MVISIFKKVKKEKKDDEKGNSPEEGKIAKEKRRL